MPESTATNAASYTTRRDTIDPEPEMADTRCQDMTVLVTFCSQNFGLPTKNASLFHTAVLAIRLIDGPRISHLEMPPTEWPDK